MKAKDIRVDLEEMKKFKIENAKERLKFIDFLAKYIKTHPDQEWSSQQNIIIDSQVPEDL